ncbi:hypothetical protein [Novosphingobium terrae]|uniref:hypothetical protein n=1 Tax=Novosphingobium terrae TaxID=2726189 RepID=UPI00197E05AA|nr:hypothetical protein [Novosphingobium terrae]
MTDFYPGALPLSGQAIQLIEEAARTMGCSCATFVALAATELAEQIAVKAPQPLGHGPACTFMPVI